MTHRIATKAPRKLQPMKCEKGAEKKTLSVGGGPTPSTSRTRGTGGTGVKKCQLAVEEVDHPMVVKVAEAADNKEVEEQPHHNEGRGGSGLGQGP